MQQPKYPKKDKQSEAKPEKIEYHMAERMEKIIKKEYDQNMEMKTEKKNYKSGNGWSSPGNPNLEGS